MSDYTRIAPMTPHEAFEAGRQRGLAENAKERIERIATAVLAGMWANPEWDSTPDGYAKDAVLQARALVAELDRQEQSQ